LRFQLPKSLRSQEQAGEASKSKDVEQTPSADNAKMQRAKALEAHNIESGEKSGENGKWEMGNRRAPTGDSFWLCFLCEWNGRVQKLLEH